MDLISTIKELHTKLPTYGFEPEEEAVLADYLAFLREREDLLELAQTYHDDIFDNHRYTLAEVEGLPEKEVAEALRLPLSSVKNRLFRARRKLQTMLNEEVSP